MVSNVLPLAASTHSPPMSILMVCCPKKVLNVVSVALSVTFDLLLTKTNLPNGKNSTR